MEGDIAKIDRLLKLFPLYSEDPGIDLSTPSGITGVMAGKAYH